MAKVLDNLYTSIANAIRSKDKTTPKIPASELAERIRALETKNRATKFPLVVNTVKGATIKAVQDSTTVTDVTDTNGKVVLWLPTEGEWKVTATKGSYTSPVTTVTIKGTAVLKYVPGVYKMADDKVENLSVGRTGMGSASINEYALFAGGGIDSVWVDTVDTYDSLLTKGTATEFNIARSGMGGASLNDYAIFAGGTLSGFVYSSNVDAYDSSLTHTTPEVLSESRVIPAGVSIGDYALFGGGYSNDGTITLHNMVDVYDSSLTKSTSTELSEARYLIAATSVGEYALFAGGDAPVSSIICFDTVDAYDSSLTHTTPEVLSVARYASGSTTINGYALFGGGRSNEDLYIDIVDAYNSSLTRSNPSALSIARNYFKAATVGNYALFGGGTSKIDGENTIRCDTVDIYNSSLTRSTGTPLSRGRTNLSAASIGNYVLFGGGMGIDDDGNNQYLDTVDAYRVVSE